MKIHLRLLGLIFFTIVMTSGDMFQPQMVDVPLINKKSELRLDGGFSALSSAQATLSYALTDKFSIQAYGSSGKNDQYYLQGAVGYFKDFGNKSVLEFYAGFGYGYGAASNDSIPGNPGYGTSYGYGNGVTWYAYSNVGYLEGKYQQYFAQVNYGVTGIDFANLEFGIGLKAGYLHSIFTDRFYYKFYNSINSFDVYLDNSLLIEPIAFIRLGGKHLKLSFKLGNSWIYKFTNTNNSIPYNRVNASIGLNYRFL